MATNLSSSSDSSNLQNSYTFQYFSDVHLEFLNSIDSINKFVIKPCAPYLIMAGDIDIICNPIRRKYSKFLEKLSSMFQYIFIVSGNREYYRSIGKKGHTVKQWMDKIDDDIKIICQKFPNVIFLQNESFNIPNTNLMIFGSTFWSYIMPEEEQCIKQIVSDYKYIPHFTSRISRELFNQSIECLDKVLKENPDKKFVVISHHLPSYELIHPRYRGCSFNSAFASSTLNAHNNNIVAWVAGHTHCPIEIGKFHVNPIGYPYENAFNDFNKVFTINI